MGNIAEARRRHVEALITAQEHGFDDAAAAALVNLGALAANSGDDRSAEKRYTEALILYRKLDDPADEALVLRDLGLLEAGKGNYPAAADRYRAALVLLEPVVRFKPSSASGWTFRRCSRRWGASIAPTVSEGGRTAGPEGGVRPLHRRTDPVGPRRPGTRVQSGIVRPRALRGGLDVAAEGEGPGWGSGRARRPRRTQPHGRGLPRRERLPRVRCPLQQSVGDGRSAALTALLTARAARELGDTADSRHLVAAAIDTLHRSGDRVAEAWALCESGNLERAMGTQRAAEASYRIGLERLGRAPATDVAACLYGGLGRTLRARGAARAAVTELERGITAIEAAATDVAAPSRRADFLTTSGSSTLIWRSPSAPSATIQRGSGPASACAPSRRSSSLPAARQRQLRHDEPRLAALRRRITS